MKILFDDDYFVVLRSIWSVTAAGASWNIFLEIFNYSMLQRLLTDDVLIWGVDDHHSAQMLLLLDKYLFRPF